MEMSETAFVGEDGMALRVERFVEKPYRESTEIYLA